MYLEARSDVRAALMSVGASTFPISCNDYSDNFSHSTTAIDYMYPILQKEIKDLKVLLRLAASTSSVYFVSL